MEGEYEERGGGEGMRGEGGIEEKGVGGVGEGGGGDRGKRGRKGRMRG
jgi:hypothetical protein